MSRKTGEVSSDFRRRSSVHRKQRDRILIVCEDEKKSVEYFEALCTYLGLTAADVRVCGKECGSAPSSVYQYAKDAVDIDIKTNGEENKFNRVYCVVDKDDHGKNYTNTLSAMKDNPKYDGVPIIPVTCIPCFEFWILLHFEATTKPLETAELSKEIKRHLPAFKKDSIHYSALYRQELQGRTSDAIKNSKRVLTQILPLGTDNPSTTLHVLVEDLLKESEK